MLTYINKLYESKKILWLIICYGIILRVIQYLHNTSLYIDEARDIIVGILGRSFSELFKPPPSIFPPSHPVGFFIVEKFFIQILGNNEFALRLFPLLAGIISIFLFYHLAKYYIKKNAIPLALLLFAILEPLIYYSTSARPYSSDVAIALLIYIVFIYCYPYKLTFLRLFVLGLTGTIAIWFSSPSVFVLTGLSIRITLSFIRAKEWKKVSNLLIVYLVWISSFIVYYLSFLHHLVDNEYLHNAVGGEDAFMPFPLSISVIKWFIARFFGVFESTAGFLLPGIAALAFLIGCISMFQEKREKFFDLILPIILTFGASCLSLYPFIHRMILFLVPSILLFIAEGIERTIEGINKNRSSIIGSILVGLLLFYPLLSSVFHIFKPIEKEEIKPVLNYIKKNWQNGDVIYIHYRAHPVFEYYRKRYGFNTNDYIVGVYAGDRDNIWAFSVDYLRIYTKDLDQLKGKRRVWILFIYTPLLHKGINEEVFFTYYLNTIGKQIDFFKSSGAAVYLYDLTKEPSPLEIEDYKKSLHWQF